MGIDPQTHEPSSTSNSFLKRLPASSSTCHMAQWESARLEAEARLSKESLLLIPMCMGKSDSNFFLRLWNSEVGDAFQKFDKGEKIACQSAISSSSTKCESISGSKIEMALTAAGSSAVGSNQDDNTDCKSYTEDVEELCY
ncbi:myb domain protein [Abeliophyllum distichum]|uniref:Myb domain protein n=1 Tax=Abeliophyllum distichum TaxID=126358 RepID=A0ABD1PNE2_9LAMI